MAVEDGSPDVGRDPRPHIGGIEEVARHRHRQRQRRHRQEQTPDPQGRQPEGDGGDEPGGGGAEQRQEEIGVGVGQEVAGRHRPHADDGELAETDLARPPGEHDQRERHQGVDGGHSAEEAELLDRHRRPEHQHRHHGGGVEEPSGPDHLGQAPQRRRNGRHVAGPDP